MSISEWDNEYARLARAATQIRTPGLATQPSDLPALQQALQRLEQQLNSLPLQSNEVSRRKRLVQNLVQTTQQGARGNTTTGTNNNFNAEFNQPQSQMTMAMRQQDDLIDELAAGMGRLKHQTVSIGEEASMHVSLLNQMEVGLDEAQAGLDAETRRAARLRDDQSVWKLQLILAGEFILLVLLIFMGLT
jgi:predicted  nucleic acid-binding Zn-ribbon protein